MAALNPSLFDAEFFGHTRGAFTGAQKDRIGYLEYSAGGTLFLDEIGILPPELQGKLLRVLQDGEYVKLGENRRRKADVRIIAATNEDLERLMNRGLFRKDLFYRLRGGWLHLPPLRRRPEDIPHAGRTLFTPLVSRQHVCRIAAGGPWKPCAAILFPAMCASCGPRSRPPPIWPGVRHG